MLDILFAFGLVLYLWTGFVAVFYVQSPLHHIVRDNASHFATWALGHILGFAITWIVATAVLVAGVAVIGALG